LKAVVYRAFHEVPQIEDVPHPVAVPGGVVVRVMASGVCLSDWHGWMGHDAMINLPHVPGHELAGVVEAVGEGVSKWRPGDRVTVPFVGGCGRCEQCESGNHQVCDRQFQPGFSHWGSFAELVSIHYADVNLVRLPGEMDFVTAASLGCRFATSFRAVVDQGKVAPGQWVAVHGCGGVGLSAIMIATALGARVLAIDLSSDKLRLAEELGASATLQAGESRDRVADIRDLTEGGPHVSLDAIGHPQVVFDSVNSLRKRGRHVQVGLISGDAGSVTVPIQRVISDELELMGSHGMQAFRYDEMLGMISAGQLSPERLIGRKISLEDSIAVLTSMDRFDNSGITVINRF
jgi:alcohol dehydrogenase